MAKITQENITDLLASQIELNRELACIMVDCPTCREPSRHAIQNYRNRNRGLGVKLNKIDRLPAIGQESQTVMSNPNNDNTAGIVTAPACTHIRRGIDIHG